MDSIEKYTSQRRRLADSLRQLRLSAGLTGIDVAQRTRMSQSKISKIENDVLLPSVDDVETLLDLYGADEQRDAIIEVAAELHNNVRTNRALLRDGSARQQQRIGRIEADAKQLRYLSLYVLPGLLQTAEHMRQVFALDFSGDALAKAIASRQERTRVLYQEQKQFVFLLTESALRWRFFSREVLVGQIQHISSISTLRNVRIGVIPLAAEVTDIPLHGYQIFDERLVTIELEHAGLTITDPKDIARYIVMFSRLSKAALFDDDARDLLSGMARSFQ